MYAVPSCLSVLVATPVYRIIISTNLIPFLHFPHREQPLAAAPYKKVFVQHGHISPPYKHSITSLRKHGVGDKHLLRKKTNNHLFSPDINPPLIFFSASPPLSIPMRNENTTCLSQNMADLLTFLHFQLLVAISHDFSYLSSGSLVVISESTNFI